MFFYKYIVGLSFLIISVFSLTSFAVEPISEPPLIPRQIIFSNPDKSSVKLSHDGKYISYLAPKNGVLNIFIAPLDNPTKAESITNDKLRSIDSYRWSYDNKNIIFETDNKGDENTRLYNYNLVSKKTKLLTPENKVKAVILKSSLSKPDELIIGLNDRDPKFMDIYNLNLATGTKNLILKNEEYKNFIFDDQLNLRFTSKLDEEGNDNYFEYKDGVFSAFLSFPYEDSTNSRLLFLDKSGEMLYMLDSRDRDLSALKKYNLKTSNIETIAESKKAELEILAFHPTTGEIQAVTEEYDSVSYKILDQDIKSDFDYLFTVDKGSLQIISRTTDDKKWLITYNSDNFPVKYYYYDRQIKNATYLFSQNKSLEDYPLAAMNSVIIKSRDGFNLVSYLTLPTNENFDDSLKTNKPLPMVLLVHGGPWIRDSRELNIAHQWLANRGYAVLSVNYRGSSGFGKSFSNAGNMQWGQKMQDDLIDAVNWAIKYNIAQPDKIAIYGKSYGGYATLCGLTLTPEVFACGIDVVGPSNLHTLLVSIPPYWTPIINKFKKTIGKWDTEEERATLASISPIFHVDKITKPLLIGQGDNDVRVAKLESDQIFDSMKKKNLDVIYLRYPNEGHGFSKASNRKSFNAVTEQFLAKHLGGKAEPLKATDFEGANFILNNKAINNKDADKIITKTLEQ